MSGANGNGNGHGEKHQKKTGLRPPWPKGYCPNPGGRPKGSRSITAELRRLLDSGAGKNDIAERMAKAGFKHAIGGKFPYFKEIIDRTDGKIPDQVQGEHEVKITVEFVKRERSED